MSLNLTTSEENRRRDIVEQSVNRKDTTELLSYDDFTVKDNLFGVNQYFTEAHHFFHFIDIIIKELMSNHSFIFRGVGRASYRLFNKAQRNFMANPINDGKNEAIYHSSVLEMLEKAKALEQNVLSDYFNSFGVKENDVAILSFLQHYGAPTPLLDWTYDIYVAIFFAINDLEKVEYEMTYSKDEKIVEDFFSIYWMREDMPQYMMNDYKKLSIYSRDKATYQTLKRRKVAHISEIYKNGKPKLFLQNNLRILKQKGIFIYNNSSHLPLEEVFFTHSFMYYLVRSPQDDLVCRSPIFCMNVHKSLAPVIKKEITKKGYNKVSMLLDAKRLALLAVPKNLH